MTRARVQSGEGGRRPSQTGNVVEIRRIDRGEYDCGIRATFDLLGEAVGDAAAARRIADANRELRRRIPEPLWNISGKLTNLGLQASQELCLELSADVVGAARAAGGFSSGSTWKARRTRTRCGQSGSVSGPQGLPAKVAS